MMVLLKYGWFGIRMIKRALAVWRGAQELQNQRPGGLVECILGAIVFQGEVAKALKVAAVVLGPEPGFGVVPGDAFPAHEPGDSVFPGGGDSYGVLTELRQAPFKEGNGVNGGQGWWMSGQPRQDLGLHRPVGNAVQEMCIRDRIAYR